MWYNRPGQICQQMNSKNPFITSLESTNLDIDTQVIMMYVFP